MTRKTNEHSAHMESDAMPTSSRLDGSDTSARAFRSLPSVEKVRAALDIRLAQNAATTVPHAAVIRAIRSTLDGARTAILEGRDAPTLDTIVEQAIAALTLQSQPHLRPVINATGVIINTNLGRAPLGALAITAVVDAARNYTNLEFDLDHGERGSRHSHVRAALRELTGAEDALVVNNNAAAILVALEALAAGREVVIARGELVEIGGGFRVPDIMAQSGARLVEVGTTNRVRISDYANAITPDTALLLVVHPSNFRIIGFTEAPALAALAALAHERGILLMHDLGSGALVDTERWGLGHEPTVGESMRAGADVVCFSGDKLLGGPQAGVILGRRAALERIERRPLMRAIRIDKLTLSALEATLRSYRDQTVEQDLPIWRAITQPLEVVRSRAESFCARLRSAGVFAECVDGASTVGGGSLPGETLPTILCAIPDRDHLQRIDAAKLVDTLRAAPTPVVARVLRDQALLDLRTVPQAAEDALLDSALWAWQSCEPVREV